MSDEDYQKIQDDVTLAPVSAIDINTASADVLGSIGVEAATVETIMRKRANDLYPYTSTAGISATASIDFKSDVFKVNSLATVGGYTKQIEAIIVRRANGTGADVRYWRSL
jgi:hypothetical protein